MNSLVSYCFKRSIKLLELISGNSELKKGILKLKEKIYPALFEDDEFLKYVYTKRVGLETSKEEIQTLVLRGSNADYGFYTPRFKNSYNLGLISHDLYGSYYLYMSLREKLPLLETVIVFLSVASIGYSLNKTKEKYRCVAYNYFFNIPYSDSLLINERHKKRIIKKCIEIEKQEDDNSMYMGYKRKSYFGTDIVSEERVKTHIRENLREPNQLNWLEKLLDQVVQDKKRFVIILSPYRNDYKCLLPASEILFKQLYSMDLKDATLLNFYDSDLFYYKDFGDSDHLNEEGAIKLTTEIQRLLNHSNIE